MSLTVSAAGSNPQALPPDRLARCRQGPRGHAVGMHRRRAAAAAGVVLASCLFFGMSGLVGASPEGDTDAIDATTVVDDDAAAGDAAAVKVESDESEESSEDSAEETDAAVGAEALAANPGGELAEPGRIVSSRISRNAEELKAEVISAEAALALRAEVDGPVVVYDSPSVSIALRRVSPEKLLEEGAELEAPDKAGIKIPGKDPRIKGRHGGPVTITVSSYHAGDRVKYPPNISSREFQKPAPQPRQQGEESNESHGTAPNETDRVDFFMTKTSVSWKGTVNVKVPGLSATVPAHDRSPSEVKFGDEGDIAFFEDKEEIRKELEDLSSQPLDERMRAYRKLARKWHPDKNPEDAQRATDVFAYLSTLKELLVAPAV
eukprot:TRINITY_DN73340_c0_g1_i1.p1 TRINITY_DN73340_c0_g1~~TRINITY_DN73340_c0_g1_i1.p1  ORF type:complete len:377 (-),score=91.54 TRINITY_DN73340_c0_g1_i1:203-1333(-)